MSIFSILLILNFIGAIITYSLKHDIAVTCLIFCVELVLWFFAIIMNKLMKTSNDMLKKIVYGIVYYSILILYFLYFAISGLYVYCATVYPEEYLYSL